MIDNPNQDADLEIKHYLEICLRRRWVVISVAASVFLVTALITLTTRPLYQTGTLLEIEKERGSGGIGGNMADSTLVETGNADYYETQYRLMKSVSILKEVYAGLHLENEEDFHQPGGLGKLEAAVSVSPVLRSRLVYVEAASHDPKLAARIADAVAETFVARNLSNTLFISKDVLDALQAKRGGAASREVYQSLPAVVNNKLIQGLKEEYAKLDAQLAEMSQMYTPRYPAMLELRSKMANVQAQIQDVFAEWESKVNMKFENIYSIYWIG